MGPFENLTRQDSGCGKPGYLGPLIRAAGIHEMLCKWFGAAAKMEPSWNPF